MAKMETYTIPYVGLKKGKHTFQYRLNGEFFKKDEHALVQDADIEAVVVFDKSIRPYTLDFEFSGTLKTECDRCASEIDLPIQSNYKVYVKFDQDADEIDDEDLEIMFVRPDEPELDIQVYLYDFALLSLPYYKECKDAGKTCNPEVIKYLENNNENNKPKQDTDPRWEDLKKLNI